ncbi:hypothetical protein, partial [Burkholderia ubonensis]|uniref:hypothetical protein n=1 Tax=Burkholderia ubonensis TaxID=101571 RepID=UPI0012FAE716
SIDRAAPPSILITFAETADHHHRNPQASPPIPEPVRSSGLVIECRGVRVCFEGKLESDVLRLVLTSLLEVGS